MKKNLVIGGSALLIIVLSAFLFFKEKDNQSLETPQPSQLTEVVTQKDTISDSRGNEVKNDVPTSVDLWNIFTGYLKAAQSHDRETLKSFSFALSSVCTTSPVSQECIQRMDAAYEAGKVLSQSDFTSLWADERQAILMTSPKETEDGQSFGLSRSVIFFAKNKEGNFGLLALDPKRTLLVKKNATSSIETLRENARKYIADSDQDGISDNFENCIFPDNLIILSECTKTNPNLRDTNGDLWWDGIGAYVKLFQ